MRGALTLVAAVSLGLAVGACGGDDEIASEPRPPAPVEVTASIKDRAVDVSPSEVGAGIVNFTVSNQSADPARLTISGPTDDATAEIPPGGTGTLKAELQTGSYEVGAGAGSGPRADTLEVGPERPSSQNDLLLP